MATDQAYQRALRFTLTHEAPRAVGLALLERGVAGDHRAFADDPDDRGGRTAYGVTQRTFTKWLADRGAAERDVWTITAAEVCMVYRDRYWLPCPILCPDRLAIALFDTCVLHGKGYAIPRLQIALGFGGDGVVGPLTRAAIAACHDVPGREAEVLQDFLQARDDRYEQLVGRDRKQVKWYKGWEGRLDDLEDLLGVPRTADPPLAA
jgi:lysozyme family protein